MEGSQEIARRLLAGERSALARLISWAENGDARFPAALSELYPKIGRAWRIGVTGPPGAGKSTLASELVRALRAGGKTVGVLAVDPSSPFSGGALLGDRIRMEELTADAGVYIRSMASRKSHGGLARAAVDACDVMDAFGFDAILVETVGVGQSEYDVVAAADTVLVVLCPGAGDGIQALKAGILEVADVLVVNKADLPGADQLAIDLEDAVGLRPPGAAWTVPVVSASAAPVGALLEPAAGDAAGAAPGPSGPVGIGEILAAVEAHRGHLERGGLAEARLEKRVEQVRRVVRERLEEELWERPGIAGRVESSLRGSSTTYDVAEEIVGAILQVIPT